MERGGRATALRRLASEVGKLVLVARTAAEAGVLAERLTLSGLPIRLATDLAEASAAEAFPVDGVASLVATHDYIIDAGPISAGVVVHTRPPRTARLYLRRLSAIQAPVHITLVLPEDEKAAQSLFPQISGSVSDTDPDPDEPFAEVLDLTRINEPARVSNSRRRFPLPR